MYCEWKSLRMSQDNESSFSSDALTHLVIAVLLEEPSYPDAILTEEDVKELCDFNNMEAKPRKSIFGYPTRCLCRELAAMLYLWIEKKECPILALPKYDLLDEQGYQETRAASLASIKPLIEGLVALWNDWTEAERKYRVRQIFLLLGRRGLLDLLGIRKTVGTNDTWPPPRRVLEETFQEIQNVKSELTVGARALAKHHHRDSSTSWWGSSTGTEKAKNDHAYGIMQKILDTAAWINIHTIVGDVTLIEARQENGYGVRWTLDGKSFRGFLEPQMVGGHDVGWKH